MSRRCEFCGKHTVAGRSICRRGKAKAKGGVGKKITGVTLRKFKPNIQKVKLVVGGGTKRVKICAQCLRSGSIQKPLRRKKEEAAA